MKKRGLIGIITFLLIFVSNFMFAKTSAAEMSSPLYFGINEMRGKLGYAIGNPSTNGTGSNASAAVLWNIVQYSNASGDGPTNSNVYCIKADVGFTDGTSTQLIQEYNLQFDMYTERDAIAAVDVDSSGILNGLVNGGHYNELLALANLIYIPGESTEQEREQLLNKSGVLNIQRDYSVFGDENYNITDEEIEAIQQAVIWYFTNYEENGKYDKANDEGWLYYTANGTNYYNMSSYGSEEYPPYGVARQLQAETLYNYLIKEAQAQASNYAENSGNINYKHKLTLYTSSTDHTSQPLMKVERNPLEFDLSLRKYITEVNEVAVANSRVPNIDTSTLESGTTATYKHRKDPVEVRTDDIITYNITIYNEGEKAGRATQIVDQLPTGLEFVEVVSGNFDLQNYDTTNNTVYLTRKSNNTTNLSAYSEGNLSSETIQIKCKVTETGGETDKTLTNLAWIAEEIDEDGTVITNQARADRDSEPSTITTYTKDQLVTTDNGYTGNSSNNGKDLTSSESYFVGQQDDDDFEKVVVRAVTSIDVSKKWDDEENQDGKRVAVTVELLRDETATGQTIILTADNNWSGSFKNLPTKIDGKEVTYSVRETTSINGYDTVVSSTDSTNGKSFTITNSYTPEETQVTVTKVWDDNNNQDRIRPNSIKVQLYKQVNSGEEEAVGEPTTLTAENWTATFTDLPVYEDGQKITYTVKEVNTDGSLNGYEINVEETGTNTFTITNKLITKEITVTKKWEDEHNQDGIRPDSIQMVLTGKVGNDTVITKSITIEGNRTEDTKTATFEDLPVYKDGQEIIYTISETAVESEGNGDLSQYTSSGEGTEENNYTITNEYTPGLTSITVNKVWNDNNNQDQIRPDSIEVQLYKQINDGAEEAVGEPETLTADDWTATFTDLQVNENGQKITYIVKEVNVPDGYTSSGDGTEANRYTITNTHKIFDLSLRKYITKVGDTDITNRTPNISTASLATGTTATYNHRKDPVVVKTGDTVVYNLTIYNEGEKAGRATKIVDQLPAGLTYVGLVDESIFTLENYDIGTNTIYLTRQDTNTENLDAYDGGDTLDSETIQVICEVTANAGSEAITLTNVAWISEEYDAEDDKLITDEENADTDSEPATKPDVNKDDLVTTGEDTGYKGDSSNPEDLTQEDYYYKGEQDDDDFEKITIEPITQVTVYKTWDDENDQDGIRPTTITINLIKDDSVIDHKEMTADSGWASVTFDNLPKYENGEEITYTVQEEDNTGYAITYSDVTYNDETNGYEVTIKNTHTPGTTSVVVNKVWDDKDNQDGLREESVVVELLKNGESLDPQETVTLSEENGWSDGFYDLPVNENGEEIVYTVRELTQIEGYETTIVDNSTGEEISNEIASVDEEETTTASYAGKSMVRATTANAEPKSFSITNTHVVEEEFDLALRKFIIAVSTDETIEDEDILKNEDGTGYAREPAVDSSNLNTTDENGNLITTAIYNHTKEPVLVKKNDIVVCMLRVYNEGEQDGYAAEITDYLPSYLEFVDGEYNAQYGWQVSSDGRTVTTRYLENSLIAKPQTDESGNNTLSYVEVPIMCKVSGNANANENITNIADITEYQDANKQPVEDRDSEQDNVEVPGDEDLPGYKDDEIDQDYVPGQEDDDDFEKVYVQDFDLALRKFISEVDGTTYNRAPVVDLSGLETGTTAIYNHTKDPVLVKRNSVVVYTLRVYNEGEIDGYAEEITDYLPEELEYLPDNEINIQYEWQVSEDGRTVTTDYLSSAKETEERQNEIKAFDGETLDYKDIQIACRVKENVGTNVKLTNLAEITEDSDEDRDSTPDNVEIPNDKDLPGYKDDEIGQDYVPGQEDDDDFEKVIVQDFDLALRKFITKVDEEDVTTRIPEITYDREQDQITYNHTKDPVEVVTGNIVEYTIRIYNEGDIAGYAQEIADDIPDGLRYLPENETNIEYRWVMYDAEGNVTENVEEAVEIRTDYLSKEQEQTEGENLLQAFNPDEEIGEGNPDYRDIKVAFEVVEPNTSDRIIVNSAQITEDSDENGNPVEDIDSIPDEWNDGEDDQDREYIKLTYFDLALRKWVTEAIVIENGQQTVTQTGHTAEMDPEPVVKVELYRKDLNDVTVKFRYSIRITNEGDIAGYATEITDYVPAGLRFLAEDNSGWTDEGNNVISTRLLENTLLQPGESAEVEVVLTWINGEDNMGQMTNIAEISEDYNDKGVPDRDSTPDNQVWGEDDIDDAPVLLSIETGQERIYFVLGFTVLGTLAGGLVLIKKFVI